MKLVHLLDVIENGTPVWIGTAADYDGEFMGYSEDAGANIPPEYQFGDVEEVVGWKFSAYNGRPGFGITVKPYKSE